MSNANKTTMNKDLPGHSNSDIENQAPENLTVLNPESETRDLNFRLKAMENSLHNLNQSLSSNKDNMTKEFEQVLAEVKSDIHQGTEDIRSETNDTRIKLGYLEGSYQSLEQQSASLAKETARLTLLLDKNKQQQNESFTSLEQNSTRKFTDVAKDIDSLDQQVEHLIKDFTMLSIESQTFVDDVSEKTNHLEKTLKSHEGDFKKLAQEVEANNKTITSRLEQVGQNFSFHDAKIMNLYEKDTELESKQENLNVQLLQAESEQKKVVDNLELNLRAKISSVSEDAQNKHSTLSSEHETLIKRTSELESKTGQLDSDIQDIDSRHQQQLTEHEDRLATHNTNLYAHKTRLEELTSVDKELNQRAQGLKETTERLNKHSHVLENTTVSLQKQSHYLQDAVNQLNKQNVRLDEKTDDLGLQIVTNSQTERQHFQTMTMAVSIVAIVTIIALIYSFIYQQSLWQSNMDNDVAIEKRVNLQFSEQQSQLMQAEHEREALESKLAALQAQIKEEQEKANILVQANQEKSKEIVQINNELKDMDDNVQFLNTSVGPLRDYSRYTGKAMHDVNWLAQQPDNHYAIQLVSVDSKQKLYQYIEHNGYSLQDDLAWFTIAEQGKDYYILTYGSYKELVQARAALSQLPLNIAEQSPGIAQLKDIQSFIN